MTKGVQAGDYVWIKFNILEPAPQMQGVHVSRQSVIDAADELHRALECVKPDLLETNDLPLEFCRR